MSDPERYEGGGGEDDLVVDQDAVLLREALEAAIWERTGEVDDDELDQVFLTSPGEPETDADILFGRVAVYAERLGIDIDEVIAGLDVPEIEAPADLLLEVLDDSPDEEYY